MTTKKEKNYLEGRLGLVIDGTGREVDKILRQKITPICQANTTRWLIATGLFAVVFLAYFVNKKIN